MADADILGRLKVKVRTNELQDEKRECLSRTVEHGCHDQNVMSPNHYPILQWISQVIIWGLHDRHSDHFVPRQNDPSWIIRNIFWQISSKPDERVLRRGFDQSALLDELWGAAMGQKLSQVKINRYLHFWFLLLKKSRDVKDVLCLGQTSKKTKVP